MIQQYEIGYHILPYFLNDWERFKNIPLSMLAHNTHLRGSGGMENGIEKPNVKVMLASKISAEDCARLNFGYLDPSKINLDECKDKENEGILYVLKAREILYRVNSAASFYYRDRCFRIWEYNGGQVTGKTFGMEFLRRRQFSSARKRCQNGKRDSVERFGLRPVACFASRVDFNLP